MNKYYLKLTSFVALFAMCVVMLPANAGAILDLDYGPDYTNGEIDSAGTDGFATTTVYWTSVTAYPAGTEIRMTVDWSNTGIGSTTVLAPCATTTAFGVAGSYTGSPTASGIVWTVGGAGVSAATYGGVCVRVPVTDAGVLYEGNFSLAILTSNADADYGAIEYYVGGGNDMLVDASVQPTLEFAVVDSVAALTETHECHLGTLDTGLVSTCAYRLRVSTNAQNGFQVQINSDKELSTASYATITSIISGNQVTDGTEGYGIEVTGATTGGHNGSGTYNQPITEDGDFATDDTPVPTIATNFVSFNNAFQGTGALDNSTLVTHRAAMDAGTLVGYYQHTVTYTVTATF